jgi:hypothetical protein
LVCFSLGIIFHVCNNQAIAHCSESRNSIYPLSKKIVWS